MPNNNMDMSNHDLGSINGTLAKLVFELLPAMLGFFSRLLRGDFDWGSVDYNPNRNDREMYVPSCGSWNNPEWWTE